MKINPDAILDGSQVRMTTGAMDFLYPNRLRHGYKRGVPLDMLPQEQRWTRPRQIAPDETGNDYTEARSIAQKRLPGKRLQEDDNLVQDAIANLIRLKRTGQKNSQQRDRAEFAVERNIAAHRRLPNARRNSV